MPPIQFTAFTIAFLVKREYVDSAFFEKKNHITPAEKMNDARVCPRVNTPRSIQNLYSKI